MVRRTENRHQFEDGDSGVGLKRRVLSAESGESFEFENLLIATGAQAKKLDCPGHDLPNVFYLRSLSDSKNIRDAAMRCKRAAVIGGGLIGMEVASVLAQKNIETTLIIREDRVCSRVFNVRSPTSAHVARFNDEKIECRTDEDGR